MLAKLGVQPVCKITYLSSEINRTCKKTCSIADNDLVDLVRITIACDFEVGVGARF